MVFLINAYSFGCLGNPHCEFLDPGNERYARCRLFLRYFFSDVNLGDCLITSPYQKDNRMTIISITHRITHRIICFDHIKKVDRIYHFLYNLP